MPPNQIIELVDGIGNLGEINLALSILGPGPCDRWILIESIYNHSGACSIIPNSAILVDIIISLNLATNQRKKTKDLISITGLGIEYFKLKCIEKDRLTKEQGIFLFSKAMSGLLPYIPSVIKLFNKDRSGELWLGVQDKRIGEDEDKMLRLLQQLKIANFVKGNIIIKKREWMLIAKLIWSRPEIDEASFIASLEERRKCGRLAEEHVANFEKQRLIELQREDLAKLVKRISTQDVAAGYDILSFNGKKSTYKPDRFIEVKGCLKDEIVFYITDNEKEHAKLLSKKYWIYIVLNVKSNEQRKIILIGNPYHAIFCANKYSAEPIIWRCITNET
jgi:hypothetical protein